MRIAKLNRARVWVFFAISWSGVDGRAALTASLGSNVKSPEPLGAPVIWTAKANDTSPGQLDYQFSVQPIPTIGSRQITQDFSTLTTYTWVPSDTEGAYQIQAVARNRSTLATVTATSTFMITSRVTGRLGQPIRRSRRRSRVIQSSVPISMWRACVLIPLITYGTRSSPEQR